MARHHVHGLEVVIHPTFEVAEQPWREIEARGAGFVFQSFDWCFTWFETIGRELDVEPVLVQVYDSRTGAAMFLPLGIARKRYGVRALGFLDGRLADHTAPVLAGPTDTAFDDVRTGAILRSVAEAAGADVLDFRHLRTPVGDRRNPLVNSRAKPASYATHSLKLGGTWEAFCEERLSKNYRADNRRSWRRLQEQGTPRIVIAGSVEQALAILESTFTQKARRYCTTGRLNLFAIDAYLEFYRRMTTRHHPSGLVHVAALVLDEQALATHWGCVHNGRFVYLMPSYDAAWGKLSPGRLLLDHLIEWSFCQSLREFDFTIGDEPYKATFCNVSDGLYRRIAARSPLGWAYWLKASLTDAHPRVAVARPSKPAAADAARP